jgi:hypothetical protein
MATTETRTDATGASRQDRAMKARVERLSHVSPPLAVIHVAARRGWAGRNCAATPRFVIFGKLEVASSLRPP